MKKYILFFIVGLFLMANSAFAVSATSAVNQEELIKQLQEQVKTLQLQVQQLTSELVTTKKEVAAIKEELQITKTLKLGMNDGEVKKLQEFLSTMPDVYPEKLVTGYFGPLTEKAVKKWQENNGIESIGIVGPKTRAKLSETTGPNVSAESSSGTVPSVSASDNLSTSSMPTVKATPVTTTNQINNSNANNNNVSSSPVQTTPLFMCSALGQQVTICHDGQTLTVSCHATGPEGHSNHISDTLGACSTVSVTPVDTTAPIISSIQANNITQTTAVISWTTNEVSTSDVYYARNSAVLTNGTLHTSVAGNVTSHSITLSDLATYSGYYYLVVSRDESGNTATSSVNQFFSLAEPVVTPPTQCMLTVSLAASTPAAQSINPGQNAVSLVKFNVTPNCDGALHSFAVSLLPMPSGYQNISALRLYNDTTGVQLGTTQSITGASVNFTFLNTPVIANQALVLRVVGDVSSSAINGSTVYGVFGGSYGVISLGATIGNNASGNIIAGNTMTVVAGSSNPPLSNSQPPVPLSPTPTSDSYSGSVGTPYTYTTMIYPDPDGNQVKATFDWGDGITTDSSFVIPVSGQSFSSTHSWSTNGVYSVKAKEVDSTGLSSAWSPATIYSTITITGAMTSAVDTTPRIMYWWGKVNQHTDENGNWLTDSDGVSGADLDKLTYCKKFFPNTVGVEDYMLETTDTWRNRGNVDGPFTSIKMSTKCLQPTVSTLKTNNQMANVLVAMQGILDQLQKLLKNR